MNAIVKPQLTLSELSRVRAELYAEKVKDWPFICEALGDALPHRAGLIKQAIASDDAFLLMAQIKIQIKDYIESELVPDAVEDFLGAKF